ncbi:MAG: outer membrane lipoprotein chaperone LolA [Desulfobacterales bacterium]
MKNNVTAILFALLVGALCLMPPDRTVARASDSAPPVSVLTLEKILAGIENRYAAPGFSARFEQVSTIKAMDISDSASGEIFVKRPGKMRWVYERPDRQTIITDGKTLWVYKPDDRQVILGGYPTFFGDGKGAGFLTDMKLIRETFNIRLNGVDGNGDYMLILLPKKKTFSISIVRLLISEKAFDILEITTANADGDETRIRLKGIRFLETLSDALFSFEIPEGVDVLRMEQ